MHGRGGFATTSGALPLSANWHVAEPLYAINYSRYKVLRALTGAIGESIRYQVSALLYVTVLGFSDGKGVTADDVVQILPAHCTEREEPLHFNAGFH